MLNEASNSKFVSRKSNIINHNSNTNYGVGSEIIYNRVVLKSNLSDYNNAYILLTGNIAIKGHQLTQVAFKNCAQFTKYITMIDGTSIDHAEDLDLVMLIYNLIEHSNYSANYSRIVQTILKQQFLFKR